MSALNKFTIVSVQENKIDLKVQIVHPDERQIIQSNNFAFQILLEYYDQIINQHIYNSNWQHFPFTQEEGNKFLTSELKEQLSSLLELCHGKKVKLSEEEYKQIESSRSFTYKGEKIVSYGMSSENYYAQFEVEYDQFCEVADQYIQSVEVIALKNFPHWFDRIECYLKHGKLSYGFDDEVYDLYKDEPNPEYVLRIITHPKCQFLLEYLKETATWESAAYDFRFYTQSFMHPKYFKGKILQYESAITPPNQELLNEWWDKLEKNWKKALLINYYIQKEMTFTRVKDTYSGMVTEAVFKRQFGTELLKEFGIAKLSIVYYICKKKYDLSKM